MNVADPESLVHKRGRILYVITKANWGGAQRNVFDLATAARDAGFEVTVAYGLEGELAIRLKEAKIPLIQVAGLGRDVSFTGDPKAFASLWQILKKVQPDVVHIHSSKAGVLATIAARAQHVPHVIFTAHGWVFNESRPWWQRAIFSMFYVITCALATNIICVSETVRQQALWMPGMREKSIVIHNGIMLIELKDKNAARAALVPHATPEFLSSTWIGTLAELHPTKALDVAIRAFSIVATQFPYTKLILIGGGQLRNQLESLAESYNLSGRIYFCGHISHAAQFLSSFDIFLFPSRSEALGYAVLEAGNAKLPVIASRVGGIPEIIDDGISGLLVPVDDIQGFAGALTKLLSEESIREELGATLHDDVLPRFSQAFMVEKTFALYQ